MAPRSGTKKQDPSSPSEEKQLKSRFFAEDVNAPDHVNHTRKKIHWRCVPTPQPVHIAPLLQRLRIVDQPVLVLEQVQEGPDLLQQTLLESQKIETVRKENFFSEEVTEEERDIIAKRVALQQRQFAEFERRETLRKSTKIRAMFEYVSDEEIKEMLVDCSHDEDEVIYRLTKPAYLGQIRKMIAVKYTREEDNIVPTMSADQKAAYQQLLKKRSETLKKTTNDQAKKQYRMGGRLGLDEALQQVQKHQIDPEKAFEGWSQARIRAYQMIDQNPNSYYYRFNAPGEVQRKGQWTEEEKKIFYERLREVGANGQWGIFSMKIPGRVGYQCSNFYRLLVETKQIHDPNYVLDERGKAHYLFDKKNANGQIQKTFRTHSKHSSGLNLSDDAEASTSKSIRTRAKSKSDGVSTGVTSNTNANEGSAGAAACMSEGTSAAEEPKRRRTTRAGAGRRRRRWGSSSDTGSDQESDGLAGYDDDRSGSFTMRTNSFCEDGGDTENAETSGQRRSKRRRRPTAAAVAAGLADASTVLWKNETSEKEEEEKSSSGQEEEETPNTTNPLPGFIDPITLEEVVKPAISKYGHVMGYGPKLSKAKGKMAH
ncbi:hypothetical protein EC973_003918 [Apophysomyces ossiformis]|uniref:Myb-like domain-containing protein n=1 Tax=Apophysomyces ossiformis TaxID=679940 RepID=A0A8H7BL52_9FUNG|nr:hypothetical protein EC973_003918 [Apophysomyces ossiformis]